MSREAILANSLVHKAEQKFFETAQKVKDDRVAAGKPLEYAVVDM